MKHGYIASYPKHSIHYTPEQLDFLHRRTIGFFDSHHTPEHVLAEAYLQGLRDAIEIFEARGELPPPKAPDAIGLDGVP